MTLEFLPTEKKKSSCLWRIKTHKLVWIIPVRKSYCFFKTSGSLTGGDFALLGTYWQYLETFVFVKTGWWWGVGPSGIKSIEAKDVLLHIPQCTGQFPINNYLAPIVNSAQVDKPCWRLWWLKPIWITKLPNSKILKQTLHEWKKSMSMLSRTLSKSTLDWFSCKPNKRNNYKTAFAHRYRCRLTVDTQVW